MKEKSIKNNNEFYIEDDPIVAAVDNVSTFLGEDEVLRGPTYKLRRRLNGGVDGIRLIRGKVRRHLFKKDK